MVNRRHIRTKVMQSVYAMLQSKSDNLPKEEKFLLYSVQKATDLYVLQMLLLVEVKKIALEHLEIRKKNYLATAEEKDPNLKFIQNKVIQAIEDSVEIKDYVVEKNIVNWKEDREYVRVIWDLVLSSETYKNYMHSGENSFQEDKDFVTAIFTDIIAPNDKLFDYYESINLGWVDDLPLVNTTVLKMIKQLKTGKVFSLKKLEAKEEDMEFLIALFNKTMLHHSDFTQDIDDKTPNWDTDRIAEMDLILIKMALVEFLHFPSIPTKVSINEYIEIAKDYSTVKSSYFVNGVLDKLLKEFNEKDRLQKIGRGLL